MPNIAVGDTLLITLNGVTNNQRTMNTFVYVCSATPSATSDVTALNALWAKMVAADGLIAKYKNALSVDWAGTEAWFQIIRPTRYRKVVREIEGSGTFDSLMQTGNLQASITRYGPLATKRDQGGIRVPLGTSSASIENGRLVEEQKNALIVLANEMYLNQSTVSPAVTWVPQVGLPAGGAPTRPCTGTLVQDTVRVIRRRTVGVGI